LGTIYWDEVDKATVSNGGENNTIFAHITPFSASPYLFLFIGSLQTSYDFGHRTILDLVFLRVIKKERGKAKVAVTGLRFFLILHVDPLCRALILLANHQFQRFGAA
jgi:hypothetical protein